MTTTVPSSRIELAIGGMTCASCANRVERKLNKLDGVTATVNYATEKARVEFPPELGTDALVAQVEAAGYSAALPAPPVAEEAPEDPTRPLRDRLVISTVLAVPVVLLAMVPAWQFVYWQWISLVLAAPVVVWGAWPFHRAAWTNLRHGAATMDTLVSMGTLAALGWSLYALLLGTAGVPGMTHPFTFTVERGGGAGSIYLEVAAGVTVFILAGRYVEARSKRQAGAALRALLDLGARDVTVLRGGADALPPAEARDNTADALPSRGGARQHRRRTPSREGARQHRRRTPSRGGAGQHRRRTPSRGGAREHRPRTPHRGGSTQHRRRGPGPDR